MIASKTKSIGLKYPLFAFSQGNNNVSFTSFEAIRTNLITLLRTTRGERVMQPTFGLSLQNYVFEPLTDELLETVQTDIEESIALWLPYVTIDDISIQASKEDKDRNRFSVSIRFSAKSIPSQYDTVTFSIP